MRSPLLSIITLFASAPLLGQTTAAVSVPEFVKAGEAVMVTGTLDRAPNFSGSSLQYYFAGPGDFTVQSSVELAAGQKDFSFSYRIPEAAKAGVWSVSRLVFYDGVGTRIVLAVPVRTFDVIANSGLIYPSHAEIALSPSEVQLLRGAALRLQAQIQDLKGRIKETKAAGLPQLLAAGITNAVTELDRTESAYKQLDSQNNRAGQVQVFFSDIRTSYLEASRSLNFRNRSVPAAASISPVSMDTTVVASDVYPTVAQGTLRALEHNERAYETVSSVGTLVFDLEVGSTPPGANISYRRRGDVFQPAPDPTNATIKSLPFAIWIVRVEAPGMQPQEKEHNALNENYHVLHFDLVPEKPKR
jgi:hypothetical protein